VRRGDPNSPTLFDLFINDLVKTVKETNSRMKVDNHMVNILLFADDIVLLAESSNDMQTLMDCLYNWCTKWNLEINGSKSKVIHFCKKKIVP
jgi:hypothetical protein